MLLQIKIAKEAILYFKGDQPIYIIWHKNMHQAKDGRVYEKADQGWFSGVATMDGRYKLPVGIENFHMIRKEGFYYVDKTGLIRELLHDWNAVTLFTRPRRFGKTLNIDMIKSFLEIGTDASLFEGLEISRDDALCERYMGKFPVIFVSLKDVGGREFQTAWDSLCSAVSEEANRFQWLMDSSKLSKYDKDKFEQLLVNDFGKPDDLHRSLRLLSQLLYKHYEKKVIILIDEYDVPLDKAYQNGYYCEMTELVRSMFSQALKTNESLYFAVLTGCLRISKESIFTGLNNFTIHTITDTEYDEYFGFTDAEVRSMLEFYGLQKLYPEVKEWYDGYRFGRANIYCPWDVLCFVKKHLKDITAPPEMYWIHTSGNAIVRQLIRRADAGMRQEIEQLLSGEPITKTIKKELTYKELDQPKAEKKDAGRENLWSILFTTGYLTMTKPSADGRRYELTIPNREIHDIFVTQVEEWFAEDVVNADGGRLQRFRDAFETGDAGTIQSIFHAYLKETISIRDTAVRKDKKENFYQGILIGLFRGIDAWNVKSNAEAGDGYSDICVETTADPGFVVEVKYAEEQDFEHACANAMEQIEKKHYAGKLVDAGVKTIYKYGIACYKKGCKVVCERDNA